MNGRYVASRAVFGIASFYAVLSALFFVFTFAPDPNAGLLNYMGASQAEIDRMLLVKGYDGPLIDRYVGYLWDVTTLDWGRSIDRYGVPGPKITTMLAKHLPYTLVYAIPAVLVGFAGGIGLGVYAAVNKGGVVDRVAQSIGYTAFGLPTFFLAEIAVFAIEDHFGILEFTIGRKTEKLYVVGEAVNIWTPQHLAEFALISSILAVSLVAGQLRYARSECLEYVSRDFVTLARAKGASEYRVMAHVARNAALPLIALFLADLVTILVVHVFILEFVFNVPGLGQMGILAVEQRNLPFMMGVTIVVAGFGVFANFLQDIGLGAVDPRTDID